MKNVFFVRHGQSKDNVAGVFSRPDTPLSEHGQEEAASVSKQCDSVPFDVILASDHFRAKQTAEIINQSAGKKIVLDPILREVKHPREITGKSHKDPRALQIIEEMDKHASDEHWHFSDEENFLEFRSRMIRALDRVSKRPEENVMVVTHSYAITMITGLLIAELKALNWDFYKHLIKSLSSYNTGITFAQYHESTTSPEAGGKWTLVTWNNVGHLKEVIKHEHHKRRAQG